MTLTIERIDKINVCCLNNSKIFFNQKEIGFITFSLDPKLNMTIDYIYLYDLYRNKSLGNLVLKKLKEQFNPKTITADVYSIQSYRCFKKTFGVPELSDGTSIETKTLEIKLISLPEEFITTSKKFYINLTWKF